MEVEYATEDFTFPPTAAPTNFPTFTGNVICGFDDGFGTSDQVNFREPTCIDDLLELTVDLEGSITSAVFNGVPIADPSTVSSGATLDADGNIESIRADFPSVVANTVSNVKQLPLEVCDCLEEFVTEPSFIASCTIFGDDNTGCGTTLPIGGRVPPTQGFLSGEVINADQAFARALSEPVIILKGVAPGTTAMATTGIKIEDRATRPCLNCSVNESCTGNLLNCFDDFTLSVTFAAF